MTDRAPCSAKWLSYCVKSSWCGRNKLLIRRMLVWQIVKIKGVINADKTIPVKTMRLHTLLCLWEAPPHHIFGTLGKTENWCLLYRPHSSALLTLPRSPDQEIVSRETCKEAFSRLRMGTISNTLVRCQKRGSTTGHQSWREGKTAASKLIRRKTRTSKLARRTHKSK